MISNIEKKVSNWSINFKSNLVITIGINKLVIENNNIWKITN